MASVLFYVQHLLGIGHLARASRVAAALVRGRFRGDDGDRRNAGSAAFPAPAFDHVALPAVSSASEAFSGLVDADGKPVDETFKQRRRDLLLDTLRDRRPDIVIIEAFPFGRRQMRFELLPLLDAIASLDPRPRLVTSIRDLLQERVKPGRNEETVELLNRHFDLVMVHGDPAFARLEDTFALASADRNPDRLYRAGGRSAARAAAREFPGARFGRRRRGRRRAGRATVEAARADAGCLELGADHRPQPAAGRF